MKEKKPDNKEQITKDNSGTTKQRVAEYKKYNRYKKNANVFDYNEHKIWD